MKLAHYKPGMTLDEPVPIILAAADWAVIMTWTVTVDSTGVGHILKLMADQVSDALYTQSSLKAARADHDERTQQAVVQFPFPLPFPNQLRPEDFTEENDGS